MDSNNILTAPDGSPNNFDGVEKLIYEVRGVQVMLDSDLAKLYGCKNGTKVINQAVNRNKERFPEDFCFQINEKEYKSLRSQIVTLESQKGKHRKYLPYVFTEQGVAMLATVLRTEVAARASISIMRAFVTMRKYMSSSLIAQKHINDLVLEDHDKIKLLESSFRRFEEKRNSTDIYFDGQIYDAYSKILDIFGEAKNELIIIDSYADKTILDIIKNLIINVLLVTKENGLLQENVIKKYSRQYDNLRVVF